MTATVERPRWAADPTALRVTASLADGRSLPVSMLTAETGLGIAALTAALAPLVDAGVVTAVRKGRWTYHRLAVDLAPELLALAPLPASMRTGTTLHAVRSARHCWSHPAGRLGVAVTDALRRLGHVTGPDGHVDPERTPRMSGAANGAPYRLTLAGRNVLTGMGFRPPADSNAAPCIDWTEQRHHLAGGLGRCLLAGMREKGWVLASPTPRALVVTDAGAAALREHLGMEWLP